MRRNSSRAAKILEFLWPVHNWHPQFFPFDVTTTDGQNVRGRVMSAQDEATGNIIHRRMTAR
jgi:hypothetical protein